MRQYPRARRIIKWCGLLASVLIAMGFVVSLRVAIGCGWLTGRFGWAAVLHIGDVWLVRTEGVTSIQRWILVPHFDRWGWSRTLWITHSIPQCGQDFFVIPLWLPLFLFVLLTTILFYRDRRRPGAPGPGHCLTCGYNLTGNVSGICPECGTPVASV